MNATAERLGVTGTHYANFDGLPWPTEHSTYSTPHDLVIVGDAAMKSVIFRDIVRQRSHKTGSTKGAGYCLLFEARHGVRTLIGVLLHSTGTNPDARFKDAARLLNWAFHINNPLAIRHGPARALAD